MPFQQSFRGNEAQQGIFIALGANQLYRRCTPFENLRRALQLLSQHGVVLLNCSRPWRTPAWPDPSLPPFLNAVARVAWSGEDPVVLMRILHEVETACGRERSIRNAPRTLDLDLVDFRARVRTPENQADLVLPHPRAQDRAFVLLPMREIAPDWRSPASGEDIDQMIGKLSWNDRKDCRPAGGVLHAATHRLKRASS
ncbi:2-amino-4-hydroxy-6-hydroxymethyldihydropteridine diphosphokinase [Oceanicaulis sp. LC35]|uniref:2-amino-4-hydroxy-6- hydroxymethyldihydropteridine diphosphokinase n=1 Tax=Oceanicaulis sp. LC35 TaxID=3349635 RepID=UPI003F866BD4